ncbi:MAG: aminoglycoside phosphotransferase family protein [Streptosporangiaceae bacterium]
MYPAVLEWAERTTGARVTGCAVRPLAGGAVAQRVDQVTLQLTGLREPLELVRKQVPAHEIAGLRAAQAVRPDAAAIPELVACGSDWLITPLAPGSPLTWGDAVPVDLVDALAALHARYHGAAGLPAAIPRVTPAWWQALCRDWVDPLLREHAARHPPQTITRARMLISRAAGHPAVSAVLAELPPTLLHGDVHPGNVLVDADRATLIDWGSSRVGPAALDLANLVTADSADVARYARSWQRFTGQPLPGETTDLGYRWAALQIPVQYLPWTTAHLTTGNVEAALDRIERALDELQA